ncbi:protein FAM136A-like [Oscarella lobularis]|uniref:protein FAM136A-like n=1 Tax=Oscarella lobularis TaxID=121494 RepID=UPI003313931F
MDVVEDSQQKLLAAMDDQTNDVERSTIRPLIKAAYLCCAKCCDLTGSREDMERCIEACSAPVAQAQQYTNQQAQMLFERFERCVKTCRDEAQDRRSGDGGGGGSIDAEERNCIQLCAGKQMKMLPNFFNNVKDYAQQLHRHMP